MSTSTPSHYIGLISGTSVDGIDAALVRAHDGQFNIIAADCFPLPDKIAQAVHRLCSDETLRPNSLREADSLLVKTHRALGVAFAAAATDLLDKTTLSSSDIVAIGSHGQTVWHQPPTRDRNGQTIRNGFSLQIGCAETIALQTGIATINDFRAADMSAGGQGAPLAPALHRAMAPANQTCAFLNLGGIANITLVHNSTLMCGYDTGPANTLMDGWINQHNGNPYDKNGEWAASGTVDHALLNTLLADPYFNLPTPKSTGREYFNLGWLEKSVGSQQLASYRVEDVQATLLALTVRSIATEVSKLPKTPTVIYCCGGGSHNQALMLELTRQLPGVDITTTNTLGVDPDYVEAALFAWLAKQHVDAKAVDLRAITGASTTSVLGVSTGKLPHHS